MPDLDFAIEDVTAVDGSLTPLLEFGLRVEEADGRDIDTIALSCQIMIEAVRRPYAASEKEALLDLFGTPERWGTSLKTMLWTHAAMVVPGFEGTTTVKLAVPTSFDLSMAPTKYFFALENGDVPLTFQFSGTVFYRDSAGALMTERISWSKEARFRLPVSVWSELMDRHYPDGAWLCLRRDVFDRLYRYKARRAVPTWETVVDELLEKASAEAVP
ncbi:MAG: hypothetical protein JF886_04725 [Candidatus Dormibacteraeota bacterium]|uniref:Uncharacterized protein n=2 Tax=Candidatus Aeolococcus gillhamiae TaxID=3127015 RepID=A0A934JUG3_9BACT|nr:hypothetical protein [Candidatus Dormibacteraeota bacterium]